MTAFRKILRWAPRVIGILSILFISIFSFDAFDGGGPLLFKLIGFLIHLIPSFVLAALLAVAWRRARVGGVIFLVVSFVPVVFLPNQFWVNVLLGAPFFLTGTLFVVDGSRPDSSLRDRSASQP